MKKIFFILFIISAYNVCAQPGQNAVAQIITGTTGSPATATEEEVTDEEEVDTTFKFDVLRAPASPASNLLGFAVSDIDKPTDVSDFMVSLQSATSSFTRLPSNYAVDIAPFLLFASDNAGSDTKRITPGDKKKQGGNIIKQTLVLSLAYKNPGEDETALNATSSYAGVGFKVSLLRGDYNSKTIRGFNKISAVKLKALQDKELDLTAKQQEDMDEDPEIKILRKERNDFIKNASAADRNTIAADPNSIPAFKKINDAIQQKYKQLAAQKAKIKYEKELKEVAATFQVERFGLSLDIAGGMSGEFENKNFDKGKIHNAGAWVNFGYTGRSGLAFILLARLLHNPGQLIAKETGTEIANTTNTDIGGRLFYSKPQSKFSASLEYINRGSSEEAVERTWRMVFNADYAIWSNQKLTFSFGRNFDGTITKDGNLVAALSFLTGFGNKRK